MASTKIPTSAFSSSVTDSEWGVLGLAREKGERPVDIPGYGTSLQQNYVDCQLRTDSGKLIAGNALLPLTWTPKPPHIWITWVLSSLGFAFLTG
jgi:hypothetical protein